jgi:CO/xanthine dehydrogenase Mo-binding subunit
MSRPFRYVGRSIPRLEDPELLSGRTRYLDDVRLQGLLEVAFVRSPYAHARLVGIRADAARAQDGVALVVIGDELGDAPEIVTASTRPEAGTWRRRLLPNDRVLSQPSSPRPGTPRRTRAN